MQSNDQSKSFDTVGFIMDWEGGNMTEEREIEGFQHLLDSGLVWKLQGCYGRRCTQLFNAGLIVVR